MSCATILLPDWLTGLGEQASAGFAIGAGGAGRGVRERCLAPQLSPTNRFRTRVHGRRRACVDVQRSLFRRGIVFKMRPKENGPGACAGAVGVAPIRASR